MWLVCQLVLLVLAEGLDCSNVTQPATPTVAQYATVEYTDTYDGLSARGWNTEYGRSSNGFCPYTSGPGWGNALSWPTDIQQIITGYSSGHGAIDIDVPIGTPVAAAAPGIVIWAGDSVFGGGNAVKVNHGGNWYTSYVHLSSIVVSCGQSVSTGQLIGYSGNHGTSYPHLHFSIRNGDAVYNPCEWLGC